MTIPFIWIREFLEIFWQIDSFFILVLIYTTYYRICQLLLT